MSKKIEVREASVVIGGKTFKTEERKRNGYSYRAVLDYPMETEMVLLTPAFAEALIANPKTHNVRGKVSRNETRLVADIKSGNFDIHHQGLAVEADGGLGDGQTRAGAVIAAQQPVVVQMTWNAPYALSTDGGSPRKIKDAANHKGEREWTTAHSAALRRMMTGILDAYGGTEGSFGNPSRHQQLDWYDKHAEALDTIIGIVSQSRYRHGAVLGISARAYEALPEYKRPAVKKFCHLLNTAEWDDPRGKDQPVRFLRDWIDKQVLAGKRLTDRRSNIKCAKVTERCLKAYLDGSKIKNAVGTKIELFPLPGDPVAVAEAK